MLEHGHIHLKLARIEPTVNDCNVDDMGVKALSISKLASLFLLMSLAFMVAMCLLVLEVMHSKLAEKPRTQNQNHPEPTTLHFVIEERLAHQRSSVKTIFSQSLTTLTAQDFSKLLEADKCHENDLFKFSMHLVRKWALKDESKREKLLSILKQD